MAIIKLGSIVTDLSGSSCGSTVQNSRAGYILRNKPQQVFSRTSSQYSIRSINTAMHAGWKSLTDQQRSVWDYYAKSKPVYNKKGDKYPLSGHSLWLKYQFSFLFNDVDLTSDPFWASYQRPLMKPFYGLFQSDIEGFFTGGNNLISWENGCLKMQFIDSQYIGISQKFSSSGTLSRSLTVGSDYKIYIKAKLNLGSINFEILHFGILGSFSSDKWSWFESSFTAISPATYRLRALNAGAGQILLIYEWYLLKT